MTIYILIGAAAAWLAAGCLWLAILRSRAPRDHVGGDPVDVARYAVAFAPILLPVSLLTSVVWATDALSWRLAMRLRRTSAVTPP